MFSCCRHCESLLTAEIASRFGRGSEWNTRPLRHALPCRLDVVPHLHRYRFCKNARAGAVADEPLDRTSAGARQNGRFSWKRNLHDEDSIVRVFYISLLQGVDEHPLSDSHVS